MIPGPLFLLILVVLTGLGIYLHFFRPWGPSQVDPIVEMRLTPFELAYLARGPRGVIETALATADTQGLLQVDSQTNLATLRPNARTDDPVVAELLKELAEQNGSLRDLKLTASVDSIRKDLMEAGLLDRTTQGQVALRGLLVFGSLEALAIAKLALGIMHNRPSAFLAFFMFALFMIFVTSLAAKGRRGFPTIAGRRCLANRRRALEPLLEDPQATQHRADARPLMTSVYGFQELSTSAWAAAIPLAAIAVATSPLWLNPAAHASSGWSGSDAGGWSFGSSDGGSSDSGCGGGSSGGDSGCGGGGGCGGCGGGGGD